MAMGDFGGLWVQYLWLSEQRPSRGRFGLTRSKEILVGRGSSISGYASIERVVVSLGLRVARRLAEIVLPLSYHAS